MMIRPVFRNSSKIWLVCLGLLAATAMMMGCGGGSSRSAEPNAPAGNQSPAASISSPSGTYFKEGENITFSGSATDAEDGPLTGSALVWTSNVDGQIGTGETLITSALSAGDHDITLTATDSEGATATAAATITVAQTRFIKMGAQTTGVTDASNAFDGDMDTAATIMTTDIEFIYFKAYLGIADTLLFKMKMGPSTPGSRLALQALTTNGAWQPVSDIDLDSEKSIIEKIKNAQNYMDAGGYINLRIRWEGGSSGDNVLIYEIWRIDPAYAGSQTTGVDNEESAYDGKPSTSATITSPWGPGSNEIFLHFKAYVGVGARDDFQFKLSTVSLPEQTLVIDVEKLATPELNDWDMGKARFNFTTAADTVENTVDIQNAQDYLDEDGYISLRLRWIGYISSKPMLIHEISRINPFVVGTETTSDTQYISDPGNAVDGDPNSSAAIYYYWGESDRYDALYVQSYLGDSSISGVSLIAAPSALGSQSDIIVEGETEPGIWSVIRNMPLIVYSETPIEILNARQYVDADGYLKLRIRWVSDSTAHNAFVYEVRYGTN